MKKKILSILLCTTIIFGFTGCTKENVKIRESETKNIKLVDYSNDLIKLKIPEGWKVDTLGDYIHYTIKAYNPSDESYQFFFNLKTEGYNKSQEAKEWQQKYYPTGIFAKTSVLSPKTTEAFYKIFNDLGKLNNTKDFTFPTINDFKVVDKLGNSKIGGDILRATFTNNEKKDLEGLFTAYVYDAGPYYVTKNITGGKKIDIYTLNVYDAIFVSAPKDELVNWEETLNSIVSSLEFTDAFMNGFSKEQDAVMKDFNYVRSVCNQISNGIMDSWNKRSASYDIMSQKQSDATLGYERVYNTDTGEIYKAYNGFTDDYDGNKYKSITDEMYTKGISGYIEK